MRIDTLYIERSAETWTASKSICARLEPNQTILVDDYQDYFSRATTPYLEKRTVRNVFIAVKRGALVREAPDAYGFGVGEPHYYFIHTFNCIYECEYCYLQGYFKSPALVFFVNDHEILAAMSQTLAKHSGNRVWFHAGEFSDSLALSHISGEVERYWQFFEKNSNAMLELRTKSINLTALRKVHPLRNAIVSFSLSTPNQAAAFDREAPSVAQRLEAMRRLQERGFRLAIHFDPILWSADFANDFFDLARTIAANIGFNSLQYVSLGAVRFAKDVFREARDNYPHSQMFARHFIQGEDNKMRYIRPLRMQLLEAAREILKRNGCPEEIIYFCME